MARGLLTPPGIGRQGAAPFSPLCRETEQLFDEVSGASAWGEDAGLVLFPPMDMVQDDLLTIREQREPGQQPGRSDDPPIEHLHGGFLRAVRLWYPVASAQVHACFDDGVLAVTLSQSGIKQGRPPHPGATRSFADGRRRLRRRRHPAAWSGAAAGTRAETGL